MLDRAGCRSSGRVSNGYAGSLDLAAPLVSANGIRYPSGLESLVNALQERFVQRRAPTRADDDALSILGDFSEPLVGRDSLIRRAERELATAEATRFTAAPALRVAEAIRTLADITHKAAEAQALLVEIDEKPRELGETIASLAGKIRSADDAQQTAHGAELEIRNVCPEGPSPGGARSLRAAGGKRTLWRSSPRRRSLLRLS